MRGPPSTSDLEDMLFASDVWSSLLSFLNIFANGAKIKVIKGITEKPTRTVRDILVAFDSCNQAYSSSWAKMQQAPIIKHNNPRNFFCQCDTITGRDAWKTHSAKPPNAIMRRSHRSGGCDVVVRRFYLPGGYWSPELRDKVFLQGGPAK